MAMYVGTILLWLAAASRVVASIKRPDAARISMTVATICIAISFSLASTVGGARFDALLNCILDKRMKNRRIDRGKPRRFI